MNLKAIKERTQKNIVDTIKGMVDEKVNVQCNYNLESEVVSVMLLDEIKQGETVQKIIVYTCQYTKENDQLSVTGFARNFGYDAFGISIVDNQPVTVDEGFISGIKAGIIMGLNKPTEDDTEEDASAQKKEDAETEVVE